MAKYTVVDFNLEIKTKENNIHYIYLTAEFINSNNNHVNKAYQICKDVRHECLEQIKNYLTSVFSLAKETGQKVDITVYKERFYLFIVPEENEDKICINQYTGRELTAKDAS